jgi:hypothetical protein
MHIAVPVGDHSPALKSSMMLAVFRWADAIGAIPSTGFTNLVFGSGSVNVVYAMHIKLHSCL